jgi:hypothetical protein
MDRPFDVSVVDRRGERGTVTTFVFSPEAIKRRRFLVLEEELFRRGLIAGCNVGNSKLLAIRVRDAVECVENMLRSRQYFHDVADPIA